VAATVLDERETRNSNDDNAEKKTKTTDTQPDKKKTKTKTTWKIWGWGWRGNSCSWTPALRPLICGAGPLKPGGQRPFDGFRFSVLPLQHAFAPE
jgi:hypothetical protein